MEALASVSACTVSRSFAAISPKANVLAVQSGIPVVHALEYASALLDTCLTQAHVVAQEVADGRDEENKAWATVFLLETVQALLGSSISGLRGEE
ncbi:DUF3077 domain-containing protein [Metapseudomonas otitidis]|uniref:DUF3077 domain-containing protein n=1 Tax=Metapseudomonas otitidis TaxID=319939 RepID=UPI00244A4E56|nr:DUF3077 domain-containing protein [Pseudomonas otitidis]MDG9783113.1 DUF3077 domain-containing protein [Pseudomonas otitidis]